jgi:hypothetical protein
VTLADAVAIIRIRWFARSATYSVAPLALMAMEVGLLKRAEAPAPSANPADPFPAIVDTAPPPMRRMAWFPVSAKKNT